MPGAVPVTHAATLNVCDTCSYTTIQAAVDAANAGDVIRVASDTYEESVTIDKSLTIQSISGFTPGVGPAPDAPTLNGNQEQPNAFVINPAVSNVVIAGFVIRNYTNAGILARSANGSVNNVTLRNNYIYDVGSYGIWVESTGTPVNQEWLVNNNVIENVGEHAMQLTNIQDSTIRNNDITIGSSEMSSGIFLQSYAENGAPTVRNVVINENTIYHSQSGAGILARTCNAQGISATITDLTVSDNTISGGGTGIVVAKDADCDRNTTIENITIAENDLDIRHPRGSQYGTAAIRLDGIGSAASIANNTIQVSGAMGGIPSYHGIEIEASASGTIQITENDLDGNETGLNNSGIYIHTTSSRPEITIEDNMIARWNVGINARFPGSVVATDNIIARQSEYGIYAEDTSSFMATRNNVVENNTGMYVDMPGPFTASENRIVESAEYGVHHASNRGTVDVTDNWWGCNYGPGTSGEGCGATPNGVEGAMTYEPWLQLNFKTTAYDVLYEGYIHTTVLTAEVQYNSESDGPFTLTDSDQSYGPVATFQNPAAPSAQDCTEPPCLQELEEPLEEGVATQSVQLYAAEQPSVDPCIIVDLQRVCHSIPIVAEDPPPGLPGRVIPIPDYTPLPPGRFRPILDLNGTEASGINYTTQFRPQGSAVYIADKDAMVLRDMDSPELCSAGITINPGPPIQDEEVLKAITGRTGITATYEDGILSLEGEQPVSAYEQVLRTVLYENTNENPPERTLTFVVNDCTYNNRPIARTMLEIGEPADPTPAPDLGLSKGDGGEGSGPGQMVHYTLSYINKGNRPASGVVITETLPLNTTFQASESADGWQRRSDRTYTYNVGTLDAGESGTVAFAVTLPDPLPNDLEMIVNTAEIGDDGTNGADKYLPDNSTRVETRINWRPDLRIRLDDRNESAITGETFLYTLHYANTGNRGTSGVVIEDTVPLSTTFNSRQSTSGWSCNAEGDGGDVCTYEIPSTLSPGASGIVTFAVDVAYPMPPDATVLVNNATIETNQPGISDINPANNTSSARTPITFRYWSYSPFILYPNYPPTANNDTYLTSIETPLTIPVEQGVLANDSDPNVEDDLSATLLSMPLSGTIEFNADGSFTYMPVDGFVGTEQLVYQVQDSQGKQSTAMFSINVTALCGVPGKPACLPDLVAELRLSPDKRDFAAGEPVQVEVVVTNQGFTAASPFWVDLYINPSEVPQSPNKLWDLYCTLTPCFGLSWRVDTYLQAGQSIVLTAEDREREFSLWDGWFAAGTTDLYVYVDSWACEDWNNNICTPTGAMVELNEENNTDAIHNLEVTGPNPTLNLSQRVKTLPVYRPWPGK
jgi:uncharacterized repeat protein (TIGR01451 family)